MRPPSRTPGTAPWLWPGPYVSGPIERARAKNDRSSAESTLHSAGSVPAGASVGTELSACWTAAAAGAGVLSYGLSLDKERGRLGRLSSVHVLPQLGLHDAGLAVAGRF